MDKLDYWSLDWFSPSTLQAFTWANPIYLFLIFGIPILFFLRWIVRYYTNQKFTVAFTKKDLESAPLTWLRFIPDFVLALVLALLLIALARPQKSNEKIEQTAEGIDIMVAIDVSHSMQIEDFKPNRLAVAKKVAHDFIDGRFQDRIGIVVFSGDAFSLAPLTTDYDLLSSYLDELSFEMIETRGTAIGSAIAVVTNRMRESKAKSKVCILLSDGDNTTGNIDPITSAQLASSYNIKIYTIVVGKEGLVPFGKDFFGRPNMVENTVDESNMRKIADICGGQFFRAADNRALSQVFEIINEYEKAEIIETRYKNTSDFYFVYLRWGIILLLIWLLLRSSFLYNILQD